MAKHRGDDIVADKGLIRTGEAFCLSCNSAVERSATKCTSCGAELSGEVKAFRCPKCQRVIALGEPQCSDCGLKFKVRSVKPMPEASDDQFLVKLIEWGKTSQEPERPRPPAHAPPVPGPQPMPEKRFGNLEQLMETINDLMKNRSEMLEKMQRRLEGEKARLAELSSSEGGSAGAEEIEAEIMSLADEMADMTMLQAHMESLSDEISALMNSAEITGAARERGLAAKALKMKLTAKEKELAELKDREEQLVKREAMVDRKIQAYAHKKKQLDADEELLKQKLIGLEEERAALERIKASAASAGSDAERELAREAWQAEQKRVAARVAGFKSKIVRSRTGEQSVPADIEAAEADLDDAMRQLEEQIGTMISEKSELMKKMAEAREMDEDIKRLLKVLDQLLGQLPEEVIDKFAKSDDFAVYERVLDRFKD
jgi:predicted RNA-binding Zn-ribbon protein involved in translation (DUF1610 family)